MGQYYKACILENSQKLDLSEQLERTALGTMEDAKLLAYLSPWSFDNGSKLMEHSWLTNNFVKAVEVSLAPTGKFFMERIVWSGDYADEEESGENLYCIAADNEDLEVMPDIASTPEFRYVINHTKKSYVDKELVPISHTWIDPDTKKEYPYKAHPLPLLTCEGCGRGGGDFKGEDPNNLVGSWARDVISVDNEVPNGYECLEFNLVEVW